jgi:riboflavin synthase
LGEVHVLFTGLIEELGVITSIKKNADGANIIIGASTVLSDIKIGDSVAVNGPCLTVTAFNRDSFTVFAMPETINKSTLGSLATGEKVNLERAMTLGGRLGGHLVSGHIDTVVTLTRRNPQGGAIILDFEAPQSLMRYIVTKGSVALDGVSLTVVDTAESSFSVGLIPHTSAETTLGYLKIGSGINLEVDLIGKYVEKMLLPRLESPGGKKETLTMSLLQEKGYI